ncbi:hypothetical protein NEOLI_002017 [Neolecta irregularis DAH-3]|uniref:Uncharacterized protein n=1 Tax=Neolecta irregularis (strain DAH-3) TaxID=1198029 RepID=A0A1U7LKT3_NEOID|nr:hypothetical protein NEOLI_002017 [Neolecta irregularis DAH-3]|eukprot:OLL23131.1 hypothetical protein NEOLI_002017 [Neolecta irregularis DAH-3]
MAQSKGKEKEKRSQQSPAASTDLSAFSSKSGLLPRNDDINLPQIFYSANQNNSVQFRTSNHIRLENEFADFSSRSGKDGLEVAKLLSQQSHFDEAELAFTNRPNISNDSRFATDPVDYLSTTRRYVHEVWGEGSSSFMEVDQSKDGIVRRLEGVWNHLRQ